METEATSLAKFKRLELLEQEVLHSAVRLDDKMFLLKTVYKAVCVFFKELKSDGVSRIMLIKFYQMPNICRHDLSLVNWQGLIEKVSINV